MVSKFNKFVSTPLGIVYFWMLINIGVSTYKLHTNYEELLKKPENSKIVREWHIDGLIMPLYSQAARKLISDWEKQNELLKYLTYPQKFHYENFKHYGGEYGP